MNTQALVDHIKRLDTLYLSADRALHDWYADPSQVNWRRWRFCLGRYREAVRDGDRRFGVTRKRSEQG